MIFFGLLAIVLDLLFIPGGVLAILGLITVISGVVCSYVAFGAAAGNIVLVCTLAVSIVAIVLILRSRTWRKCALNAEIDTKMNEFDEDKIKVGAVGETISRLAPSGKAVFDGDTVEVTSAHGLIDENSKVRVLRIDGNKITVELAD